MNIALQLRRRLNRGPAVALLLPSRDVAGVLGLCARLGLDPSGRVHDVAGGFLLRLDDPTTRAFPGVVRLRSLAENLFVPVDADLVPALLDDEAEGLTRKLGLIVLPDGRILGFDPAAPLAPSTLLTGTARPQRHWQPLPPRPPLADRIEEIAIAWPDESAESVLEAGAGSIGIEPPRPDAAGSVATIVGSAALGAGMGLAWLGNALGLGGLTRLGATWVGRALKRAPRLSETLLDRQAAALRALLNDFRAGDLERALRRALPLGEPGSPRGAVPDASDRLPTRRTTYALNDLLSTGPAATWFVNQDVMAELAREYRKAALNAAQTGDCRRAAFIYGTLLNDYSAAAQVLFRGGLYHDAAILFLAKLNDRRSAALAFEAGGEFDRAVTLFRALGDHVAAGDLLRRIGQEDEALEEYRLAADLLAQVERHGGRLAAGELLLSKVGDGVLARTHFAIGWGQRPAPNAVSCALRLLRLDATAGNLENMRELLDQASAFFAWNRDLAQVERFYNELATLAGQGMGIVAAARAELRDRALLSLATELRARANPGASAPALVAILARRPDTWPAAVISDADFAIAAATRVPSPAPRVLPTPAPGGDDPGVQWLRASRGVVTACCAASETGEVFLGFEEGKVLVVRPERSEVACVADDSLAVTALAVSAGGSALVTLRSNLGHRCVLSSYERTPRATYRAFFGIALDLQGPAHPGLTSIVSGAGGMRVGIWDGSELAIRTVSSLEIRNPITPRLGEFAPPVLLLRCPPKGRHDDRLAAFAHNGQAWTLFDLDGRVIQQTSLNWRPSMPPANSLRSLAISWTDDDPDQFEIAGLGGYGTLHWAAFHVRDGRFDLFATNVATEDEGGYVAATIIRPGLIAGVTRSRVDWLRCGSRKFTGLATTPLSFPTAVACVANRRAGELVVIGAEGLIARVPIPFWRHLTAASL